jgi:hypothetical protein
MRRLLSLAVLFAVVVGLAFAAAAEGERSAAPVTWSNVRPSEGFVQGTFDYTQCALECPPGALLEGEPVCYDGYDDHYNGGCNSVPPVFQVLQPSCRTITVCGTSGVYSGYSYRDTDWFQISLTEQANLNICCTAEFPLQLLVVGDYGNCNAYVITSANAGECQQACIPIVLPAGTYWIWVGPSDWGPYPCGGDYVLTVEGYGQGEQDICCVVPPSLDFGSVEVGRYLDLAFMIINTWGEPLVGDVTESCDAYSIISGGGPYNLAPGESLTVTVRFAPMMVGEQDCQIATGIDCPAVECTGIGAPRYCTFPCWSWAAGCLKGPNRDISTLPACIRDDSFDDAFPSGLMVGVDAPGRHKALWTSADAVRAFACGYGIPAALGEDYVDPASNGLGSIYGEVLALRLSREFSCKGYFSDRSKCLGTAVVPAEMVKFAGLTVDQLLSVADEALSGNASALLPYGNSLFRLQSTLAYMNQLYDDCGLLVSEPGLQEKFDDELPGGTAEPLPSHVLVTSHPNPLRASVTIGLALPAAGNVTMELYDVQGRRVVTMASRPMSEGHHDVTWDGADQAGAPVAAGVYFLRVQVDGQAVVMHKLTKL